MPSMDARCDSILEYIREYILENNYPPTVREIGAAVGLSSPSTVHLYLKRLEERGAIRRSSAKTRAIELLDGSMPKSCGVPLVGHVTAGVPILAIQNVEQTLALPAELQGDAALFALRVRGESMIEAGIYDRDIIVVRRQSSASNGDIVVAMIDDEATVKRIFYETNRVRLQPENSAMTPIYAPEVTILGKVVALYRRL